MTEQDQQTVLLTPEQQRCLGHVYRMILGWRRENIRRTEKLLQEEAERNPARSVQSGSNPARPSESGV